MNDKIEQLLKTGKIPVQYQYDVKSAAYFGLAVLAIILIFNLTQAFVRRLVGG